MLFQGSEIVRGAHWLDIAKLTANRFSHGHGGVTGAHQEVRAWFGERSTPVGSGNGRVVQARLARVARDAANFGCAGISQTGGFYVIANHGGAIKVNVCESAIHHN